jgi:Xaa-Pro aminopeptidase
MKAHEFRKRREQLMRMVGKGGIAILPSAPVRIRSRDVEYRYRQDSDFFYLTGFAEPDAVAVLAPGRASGEFVLFCRERDPDKELWDGSRAGPDGATGAYGADDAFPIDDIDDIIPGLIESCTRVYYTMGAYTDFDARIAEWINSLRSRGSKGVHTPQEFVALDHLLHDMRLFKSRAEISAMRRAARVAVQAHERAMQTVRPGMFEYEVEAEFRHEFRRNNAWASYNPIVGGGRNSCTLHYVENAARLAEGDLLLIDAGCELDYYASDVTRTFPVSGRFSPAQRAVYEVVLQAELAAIAQTAASATLDAIHDVAVKVLTEGMIELGLIEGSLDEALEDKRYKRYYMHSTSHYLGMDVHDVGRYKRGGQASPLEAGVVITVEPGIYIAADDMDVKEEFRGIGIRIEDDVLVEENGIRILSEGIPKTIEAVEEACAEG